MPRASECRCCCALPTLQAAPRTDTNPGGPVASLAACRPSRWRGFLSAVLAAGCTLSFPEVPRGAFAGRCGLRTAGGDLTAWPLCSAGGEPHLPLQPAGQTQDQQLQSLFAHRQPSPSPSPLPLAAPPVPASCSLCPGSEGPWLGAGLGFSQRPGAHSRSSARAPMAAFASDSSGFHRRQH